MLGEGDAASLREFCTALHPAKTAEFMEGLDDAPLWDVLQHADPSLRSEIFNYFEWDRQVKLLSGLSDAQVAELFESLAADDVVDLIQSLPVERVELVLALMPATNRRELRRLQTYREGTAGAIMTTEAAMLAENLTVRQALEQLSKVAETLETVYYLYIVDLENRLRGVVSARAILSAIGRQDTKISELMETDVVSVDVEEDQLEVAEKVARYNLLAIPVVDDQHKMLGIITHDDVIDVIQEEAAGDLQRSAAVEPLPDSYMRTDVLTLSWKRGMWLTLLFFFALLTAFALDHYDAYLAKFAWLIAFIPLIISSGGNSGSQSSTLVITALATKDVVIGDWAKILRRELIMGFLLGGFMASIGYITAIFIAPDWYAALVIPITILSVVVAGCSFGSILPLVFKRMGLDPALMSNPFVAGIIDILGILIYLNVAMAILEVD